MSTFFKIVRYLFAIFFVLVLLVIFFAGIPLNATTQTFIHRDNVKSILETSGIYDNFIDILVEQSQNIDSSSDSEIITLLQEDPEFQLNIKTLFSSDEIQPKVEIVIDAFYDWLEGKTTYPQFEVSLIDDEDTFKNLFLSVMMLRMESLPTCSSTEKFVVTDIMDIECIPVGTNLDSLEVYFEEALDSGQLDISEATNSFTFSSDQLNISYENAVLAQSLYRIAEVLPILLAVVIFLVTLIIFLLIPSPKGAAITISVIYILTGLVFVTFGSLQNIQEIVDASMSANTDLSTLQSAELVTNLFTPILESILHNIFIYSLVILGAGVVFLIIGIVIKKKDKKEVNVENVVATNEEDTPSKS
ncbi:MAG: hypothetical protein PHP08_03320 [Candidatus Dojkabacteria bacterium]|nr:hypothetical protein [Candidatus Dojkabacteria bacterium]